MTVVVLSTLAAGCASSLDGKGSAAHEEFDTTSVHSRIFAATPAQTCEAARRALLSQGYVANIATPDQVNGRKNFQPENELHVEVEFRVVCAADTGSGSAPRTLAFVSALQERYALKKVNNSASLGVGVLGSVSLPFSSSDDALVKVASETLGSSVFYDRFFRLIERYLPPPEPVALAAPASSATAFAVPSAAAASAPP